MSDGPSGEDFARAAEASRESREVTVPEMQALGRSLDNLAAAGSAGIAVLEFALAAAVSAVGGPAASKLGPVVTAQVTKLIEGAIQKARG